ncbi:MAG: hypothetical protein AUI55_01510 [Gemmatimonadetes bacterium 13_1_40CM_2_70_7]|nr:MAG: hypothetical protein AUJ00_01440 [Gemmatimonadetes bacterium 13_1_40CM_3_70_6]OLD43555.1 MAG: hypothetical protein AUI55_01510 [Gemmatimonadetes bacterium 13_1_40CM_2_70_7]PYO39121.1 MAG: hypothetical protein DMD29_10585 [Gemmatimonadota bacterium]
MIRRSWLVVLGAVAAPLAAQGVMVAPHAVFMNSRTNSGVVTLYNPNTEAAEVSIATFFGYPETDSLGGLRLHGMPTSDSAGRMVLPPAAADSGQPSAARWVQAFPRRLTVAPRERQTVRLLASPPPGLPDGEYWLRLVIAVKGGVVPVTGVADTGIKIGLTLEVRTIIGVNYRKGPVRTGVAVTRLRAAVVGDSLEVRPRLERQGNAAFIGTVRGTLVDSAGRERARFAFPIGVYYVMEPRYMAPVGVLPAGRYWLKLTVDTDREDLEPAVVLPAAVVRDSVVVRVP